jgi:hypothetical protein
MLLTTLSTLATAANHGALQIEGVPPALVNSGGWIVGTTSAGQYARRAFGVLRDASTFGATPEPSNGPDNVRGDCARSELLTGVIVAGDWDLSVSVAGQFGSGGPQQGRPRIRLWRGTVPTGAGATEITSGAVVGSTVSTQFTLAVATATVALGEIVLEDEYLFIQYAWEIVTAAASVNHRVLFGAGAGTQIMTPQFFSHPVAFVLGARSTAFTLTARATTFALPARATTFVVPSEP